MDKHFSVNDSGLDSKRWSQEDREFLKLVEVATEQGCDEFEQIYGRECLVYGPVFMYLSKKPDFILVDAVTIWQVLDKRVGIKCIEDVAVNKKVKEIDERNKKLVEELK